VSNILYAIKPTYCPQLNDLIQHMKINPEPPIRSGRRLRHREPLPQAAEALGVLTDELRAKLEQEVSHVL